MAANNAVRTATHAAHSFGNFTLDVDRGALLLNGNDVKLRPQAFEVLKYLIDRHGTLVAKDELLDAIWRDKVVTDDSLTQCLSEIRKAIGDKRHRIVRTVPRRGYRFDLPVDDSNIPDPATPVTGTGKPWAKIADWPLRVVLGLVAGLAVLWWAGGLLGSKKDSVTGIPLPPHTSSIAILPFVDMTADQSEKYLADGIAEEILHLLAQSESLKVIARTSSFSADAGKLSVKELAELLNVAYVLEGSVRKSGSRLRVTAQLVDGANSMHVWSETYDRESGDILDLQSEIATAVADVLKVKLPASGASATEPVHADTYQNFLQAQFFYQRRTEGDLDRAETYYRRTVEREPNYARAWVGLAATRLVQTVEEGAPKDATLELARAAIERALALDPQLPEAHIRAESIYFILGHVEKAREHQRLARSLGPNRPLVLAALGGNAAWAGRMDEAIALLRRAVAHDPLAANYRSNLALYLLAEGRVEEARRELDMTFQLRLSARLVEDDKAMASILILENNFDEAYELVSKWPDGGDKTHCLAMIYHGLGKTKFSDASIAILAASEELEMLYASPRFTLTVVTSRIQSYGSNGAAKTSAVPTGTA